MADKYVTLKMSGLSLEEADLFRREIALNMDRKLVKVFSTLTDLDGNLYLEAAGPDPDTALTTIGELLVKFAGRIDSKTVLDPQQTALRTKESILTEPIDRDFLINSKDKIVKPA